MIVGGALILLMLLIPPWRAPSGGFAGYGLLFDSNNRFVIYLDGWPPFYPAPVKSGYLVLLDFPRLFLQCLFVTLLFAGIVALMKRPPKREEEN